MHHTAPSSSAGSNRGSVGSDAAGSTGPAGPYTPPGTFNDRHSYSFPQSGAIPIISGPHTNNGTPSSTQSSYANRAAKATGALARFGKAFYGANVTPPKNPSPSNVLPDSSRSSRPSDTIRYKAKGSILAMAASPDGSACSIIGKDCK